DTHVGFDARGVGYYASKAAGATVTEGFFVLTTTTGSDWSKPVPVALSNGDEGRNFSSLAVDGRAGGKYAGSLYMFWLYTTNVSPYWHGIAVRYSRDGGLTWSTDIQISDKGHEISYGPSPAVASDGTVYVASEQLPDNRIFNEPNLYLDRSTD